MIPTRLVHLHAKCPLFPVSTTYQQPYLLLIFLLISWNKEYKVMGVSA